MEKEFEIEFNWQDIPYMGMVTAQQAKGAAWYKVTLESENQESYMEITVKPSASKLQDWDFECNGEDATAYYDKDLLTELGEAIDRELAGKN